MYFHPEPDGRGFWVITKFDDVRAVLRDYSTFSSEVGGAARIEDLPEDVLAARRNFLEFDPPKHGRYRRLFSADFTPPAVARYEDWLRALVRARLDAALPKRRVRPRRGARRADPDSRARPHPRASRARSSARLIELGDRLLVDTEPDYVGELAYHGEQDEYRYKPFGSPWADELCALGRAHYAERRACPREDVLSLIANGTVDGRPLDETRARQHVRADGRRRQRDDAPGDRAVDARARTPPGAVRAAARGPRAAAVGGRGAPALLPAGLVLPAHRDRRGR